MMEILIALISSGLIIFIYKEYKDYIRTKIKHDLKIYRRINLILTDKHILSIIKETQDGYLPKDTYWRSDTLVDFIQQPKNKFLDNKLNKLLSDLVYDLHNIAQFYSMCSRCDCVGTLFKLVYYKNGDPEEIELYKKSRQYSNNLLKSYRAFRLKIKKKFKI